MILPKLIAAAGLLLALGAHAVEPEAAATPEAPASSASAVETASGTKLVCTREQLVGSRLSQRVCRVVDPALDDFNRREMNRAIHQGSPAGSQGVSGKSGG